MTEKDIVKFREPMDEDEAAALMVVREKRGDRVLVSDLRFVGWSIPPTSVYAAGDLEIVNVRNVRAEVAHVENRQ